MITISPWVWAQIIGHIDHPWLLRQLRRAFRLVMREQDECDRTMKNARVIWRDALISRGEALTPQFMASWGILHTIAPMMRRENEAQTCAIIAEWRRIVPTWGSDYWSFGAMQQMIRRSGCDSYVSMNRFRELILVYPNRAISRELLTIDELIDHFYYTPMVVLDCAILRNWQSAEHMTILREILDKIDEYHGAREESYVSLRSMFEVLWRLHKDVRENGLSRETRSVSDELLVHEIPRVSLDERSENTIKNSPILYAASQGQSARNFYKIESHIIARHGSAEIVLPILRASYRELEILEQGLRDRIHDYWEAQHARRSIHRLQRFIARVRARSMREW